MPNLRVFTKISDLDIVEDVKKVVSVGEFPDQAADVIDSALTTKS